MREQLAQLGGQDGVTPQPFAVMAASLMESLSIGLLLVNPERVLTFINGKAEELLQVGRDQVLGKRVDMLPLRSPLYKVLSENCREPQEMNVQGRTVAALSYQANDLHGALLGELVELRDITRERKEKRQREEFVAMMTHDLKSPLTVMMGYLQIIRANLSPPPGERLVSYFTEIEHGAARLLAMIEDVLDSYRLEVGLLAIAKEYCDIKGLLEGCCRDNQREAVAQGVELSFTAAGELPPLEVDARQLARVFANLVGNAIKFTPDGGKVALAATCSDAVLQVCVADSGIGIPAQELEKVFKKYYRAEGVTGYKGTGLGLTISKAIVEAHGGTIKVESTEGKGSRFTVTIPVHANP